jgi:hypothetical protein
VVKENVGCRIAAYPHTILVRMHEKPQEHEELQCIISFHLRNESAVKTPRPRYCGPADAFRSHYGPPRTPKMRTSLFCPIPVQTTVEMVLSEGITLGSVVRLSAKAAAGYARLLTRAANGAEITIRAVQKPGRS